MERKKNSTILAVITNIIAVLIVMFGIYQLREGQVIIPEVSEAAVTAATIMGSWEDLGNVSDYEVKYMVLWNGRVCAASEDGNIKCYESEDWIEYGNIGYGDLGGLIEWNSKLCGVFESPGIIKCYEESTSSWYSLGDKSGFVSIEVYDDYWLVGGDTFGHIHFYNYSSGWIDIGKANSDEIDGGLITSLLIDEKSGLIGASILDYYPPESEKKGVFGEAESSIMNWDFYPVVCGYPNAIASISQDWLVTCLNKTEVCSVHGEVCYDVGGVKSGQGVLNKWRDRVCVGNMDGYVKCFMEDSKNWITVGNNLESGAISVVSASGEQLCAGTETGRVKCFTENIIDPTSTPTSAPTSTPTTTSTPASPTPTPIDPSRIVCGPIDEFKESDRAANYIGMRDFIAFAKVYLSQCDDDIYVEMGDYDPCGGKNRRKSEEIGKEFVNSYVDIHDFIYFARVYKKDSCLLVLPETGVEEFDQGGLKYFGILVVEGVIAGLVILSYIMVKRK